MRAILIHECGGTEKLRIEQVSKPARKPSQALVKSVSIGVNPVDLRVRTGFYKPEHFPKVLGGDVAGVVEEPDDAGKARRLGGRFDPFKKGDKVMALTPGYRASPDGCYAEYVAAEADWLARVPDCLPLDEAGGLPLVALTAWQALQQARPAPGKRALVTAASGGVGHVAVQLAKALGLYVVGIAGPKNVAWVKEALGADEVVDYTTQDVAELYSAPEQQFDIAIDCMGTRSGLLQKLLAVTKPSGHVSHMFNAGTDNALVQAAQKAHEEGKGPGVGTVLVTPSGEQLQEIADLVAAGKVKLTVAAKLPLTEAGAAEAHDAVATGHTRGKIVLLP